MRGRGKVIQLEEKNARQGFFTQPEIDRVIANLSDKDIADFVVFGWLTGWRKGEIASLLWSDLIDDCLVIDGKRTKNGEDHKIALVGELSELIARRKAKRAVRQDNGSVMLSPYIFHRDDGKPIREFRKSWHTAVIKAGLGCWVCPTCTGEKGTKDEGKHISQLDSGKCPRCEKKWKSEDQKYSGRLFHDLRRSAVRDMINAGVPQVDAKKISGHTTDSMFERYNIRATDDVRRALERTQEYRKTVKDKVVAMAANAD